MDQDQAQQDPMSFDEAKAIVEEALAARMPAYIVEERTKLTARMDRRVDGLSRERGDVVETAREHEKEPGKQWIARAEISTPEQRQQLIT